jgi:ZIP family zinc transporter
MHRAGLSLCRIYLMWLSITLETALGACIAAAAFPSPPHSRDVVYAVHAIEGLAGGAMLTVICETMLPEAFHEGGKVVGMSALCGFLAAMIIKAEG